MKKLNQYILEKFKVEDDIDPNSSDEFNDSHYLAKKMAKLFNDFIERKQWPKEKYTPKFSEHPGDRKEKYRMYTCKDDDSIFMYGETPGQLYINVAKFFGTEEDKKEAQEYIDKYEKNK